MTALAPAENQSKDQKTPTTRAMLKEAVHANKIYSKKGMLERMFTMMFQGFVYPQIWEDPELDMEAMELDETHRIMKISSGGCNILNYLTENPRQIDAIDLNQSHVAMAKLKFTALKHLPDYESFFMFFGEADKPENIKNYDTYIKPHLEPVARKYWEGRDPFVGRRINYFKKNIYRYGLLGKFIGTYHLAAKMYGQDMKALLEAENMDDQSRIFRDRIAPLFDKKFVRFCCNMPVSLYGLGIPPAQFEYLSESSEGDMAALLQERLRHLACDFDMKDNYFAWQAFGRGYDRENRRAVPRYLKEENYEPLKNRLHKANVSLASMHDYLGRQEDKSLDRFVLLDAQDWMNDDVLNALWAEITRTARKGSRVIFRTAGFESPLEDALVPEIREKWNYDPEQAKELIKKDRSSIYGGFHLYTLKD